MAVTALPFTRALCFILGASSCFLVWSSLWTNPRDTLVRVGVPTDHLLLYSMYPLELLHKWAVKAERRKARKEARALRKESAAVRKLAKREARAENPERKARKQKRQDRRQATAARKEARRDRRADSTEKAERKAMHRARRRETVARKVSQRAARKAARGLSEAFPSPAPLPQGSNGTVVNGTLQ